MSMTPFIPDSAPFSPDQRAWLNGFLAGMFSSSTETAVAPKTASLKVALLYASQTGTGEGLARKVAKELKARGHVASVASLENYASSALAGEEYAVFVVSTYGEGEAPDGARRFYDELCTILMNDGEVLLW